MSEDLDCCAPDLQRAATDNDTLADCDAFKPEYSIAANTSKMVCATRNTPVSIINAVGKFNSPTGLGSQMIQQMAGGDYQVIKMAVMGEVKTHFRPEFINRIDEVVVFRSLGDAHIASIAKIQIQYLAKRLAAMEMKLDISDAALAEIAKAGFDPVYGARPLKRAIQSQIENPLSKQILEGKFATKDTIKVDAKRDLIVLEKA